MKRQWFNGALIGDAVTLDARDRGLSLGDGLFETLLVVNATPLWANMHLARMEGAANELGLAFDRGTIDDAISAILDGVEPIHHVLRVSLTRGSGVRGLGANGGVPSLLITLDPFDPALMFKPVTLATSTVRRSPSAPSSRLKTLSYIDNIAAAREAAQRGMEDALMLNTSGHAACSTIANLFLLKDGTLITPARDQGILTGVTRQALIASAPHLGLAVEERAVDPGEIFSCDAAVLTNSLRFIRPIRSLDQRPVPQADLSRLADALCEAARLQCGRDPRVDLNPSRD